MENMKENSSVELVIAIDDKLYEIIKNPEKLETMYHAGKLCEAVKNGIPLPKGHGRIVDIGPYEGKVIASRTYCGVNKLIEVAELDTIIEADKENYNNYRCCDGWCNTCEYKYLESECAGCAKYDEYDNLIALSNYKAEEKSD